MKLSAFRFLDSRSNCTWKMRPFVRDETSNLRVRAGRSICRYGFTFDEMKYVLCDCRKQHFSIPYITPATSTVDIATVSLRRSTGHALRVTWILTVAAHSQQQYRMRPKSSLNSTMLAQRVRTTLVTRVLDDYCILGQIIYWDSSSVTVDIVATNLGFSDVRKLWDKGLLLREFR